MASEHYEELISDHESYCLDHSSARITGIFAYSDCSSLGQCLVDTETPFPPLSLSEGHYNLPSTHLTTDCCENKAYILIKTFHSLHIKNVKF